MSYPLAVVRTVADLRARAAHRRIALLAAARIGTTRLIDNLGL